MSSEAYGEALSALSTLISKQKRSKGNEWENAFSAMRVFLERLQLQEALTKLKVIHVAGTKGKGSTCCMTESVMRSLNYKTGLFTSPHLVDVRERIRINGRPVGKEIFLQHFWECYNTFRQTSTEEAGMPAYFRFLTLLSFKVFIEEKVDVVILEVGLGGRLDATNIVPQPIVCGVTSLGFDHMELLGYTLGEIATEKAGIFKRGSPALTIPQEPEAQQALEKKASEVGVDLTVVSPLEHYFSSLRERPQIGLAGRHQEINASLAIALCGAFEGASQSQEARRRAEQINDGRLPKQYLRGLTSASWPGRCQVINEGESREDGLAQLAYYLDGAHTQESMAACGHWFADSLLAELQRVKHRASNAEAHLDLEEPGASLGTRPTENIMIFNCMEERESGSLLKSLVQALETKGVGIQHALFVPPDSRYSKVVKSKFEDAPDLQWQVAIRNKWEAMIRPSTATYAQTFSAPRLPPVLSVEQDSRRGAVVQNLRSTMSWIRSCKQQNQGVAIRVLVTGSLYLVGDMLQQLGQDI